MTQNVLSYLKQKEDEKHNRIMELETERSNREREAETKRHNLAMELENTKSNEIKQQEANIKGKEADIKEKQYGLDKRDSDRVNYFFENYLDDFTEKEKAGVKKAIGESQSALAQGQYDTLKQKTRDSVVVSADGKVSFKDQANFDHYIDREKTWLNDNAIKKGTEEWWHHKRTLDDLEKEAGQRTAYQLEFEKQYDKLMREADILGFQDDTKWSQLVKTLLSSVPLGAVIAAMG